MSEFPLLLPHFPPADPPGRLGSDNLVDYYRTVLSPDDLGQYVALRRAVGRRWYGFNDARHRSNDAAYTNFLATYQVYGSGYTDAARRYAPKRLGKKTSANDGESRSQEIRFSRVSVALFSVFIILIVVSVAVAIRGFSASSNVTVEVAVYLLGTSLYSGLAWLGRAEVEQRRTRTI